MEGTATYFDLDFEGSNFAPRISDKVERSLFHSNIFCSDKFESVHKMNEFDDEFSAAKNCSTENLSPSQYKSYKEEDQMQSASDFSVLLSSDDQETPLRE
jgi:hypothetical protein